MSTFEDDEFPASESIEIANLVEEIDQTMAMVQTRAKIYLDRPLPLNFKKLLSEVVDHVYAVHVSIEHILGSDEEDKVKIKMINSFLTQTIRMHASNLNAVLGSEEYHTDGEFSYSATIVETGEQIDIEDPETEFNFPDPEATLTMITEVYGKQIGEDILALRERAESQGLGRLIALGRQAGNFALSNGLDVAKTATAVAIGIRVAKLFDEQR